MDPIALAAEIAAIADEFGPLDDADLLDRLADGINPETYDGGAVVARAVAAELRRKALRKRNSAASSS